MNLKLPRQNRLQPPLAEPEKRILASYGRRKGRKLRPSRQGLMETLLPNILIALQDGALNPAQIFSQQKIFWLEIGFGAGEHIAHQAQQNPNVGIIGCEPYINGIAGMLSKIEAEKIDNIRVYSHDARFLIERLPDASIERAFILYPDPWPKTRHHRRRLVQTKFLTEMARILKPGAELRLATDDEDYGTWMLAHLLAHPDFKWTAKNAEDWLNPPPDWIRTRYEQKAVTAGRAPTYLNFVRT